MERLGVADAHRSDLALPTILANALPPPLGIIALAAVFSAEMSANDKALKAFLFERMYRHYKVNRMASKARRIVQEIFALLLAEPECLPTEWRALVGRPGSKETARLVADYIAGMTDRFALDEHARLFDTYATTT